jgi:hypothetical protein
MDPIEDGAGEGRGAGEEVDERRVDGDALKQVTWGELCASDKYLPRVEKRETTHNVGDQLRKFIRLRLQTKPGERDGEIAALLAQVDPSKRRFERNPQGSLDDLGDGEPKFVEWVFLEVQGCDERGHFEILVGAGARFIAR